MNPSASTPIGVEFFMSYVAARLLVPAALLAAIGSGVFVLGLSETRHTTAGDGFGGAARTKCWPAMATDGARRETVSPTRSFAFDAERERQTRRKSPCI